MAQPRALMALRTAKKAVEVGGTGTERNAEWREGYGANQVPGRANARTQAPPSPLFSPLSPLLLFLSLETLKHKKW